MHVMNVEVIEAPDIPADLVADGAAVRDAVLTGRRLDPEVQRRIRERAAKITEELRRQGPFDVGVRAIRELRDA